jgi:1,4-alpha-glucan branching enzyme
MNEQAKKDVGAVLHGDKATFRVWAPFAKAVAVAGSFNNWAHAPMQSENDGYWSAEIGGVLAGQEYKFVINDGTKDIFKNDPRSLSVTTSMGSSVVVDTNFDWEDDEFTPVPFNKHVIYELHVGTFNRPDPSESGTFDAAMKKLDHLAELGVNIVELMPISTMMDDRGWGYATNYIYSVESLYGGRKQFLEFVKKAHQKGIGVVLDVVYNHFGPGGGLDLWQFDGWNQDGHGGIYFYNDWRSDTPWGATRPDFGRLEVREYITDNVRMWMKDCHLDGLRVDSTIYIRNVKGHNDDPSNDLPDGWSILQDVNTLCKEINKGAITIAEDVGANNYITKPSTDGGAGFSAQWEVGFPHALRSALDAIEDSNRNISEICNELSHKYNSDVFQRVVYSDSHDSASNGGARLNEEIAPGNSENIFARQRSLIAAAIVLSAPGIPMLLQGQEFMQGGSFNDWQALDWKKAQQFSGIVMAHKHLISLRKNEFDNTKGLTGQSFNILHLNEQNKVLAYHRWENGGVGDDAIVVINFTNSKQSDYVINFPREGIWKARFNSSWKGYSPDFEELGVSETIVQNGNGKLNLAPYCVLILSQDE